MGPSATTSPVPSSRSEAHERGRAAAEADLAAGETAKLDEHLFDPHSDILKPDAWCRFGAGITQCLNGEICQNPHHVEDRDPWRANVSIRRDRFGRYLLPDPATGAERSWTRVTTAVKGLEGGDTFHLQQWMKRMVAFGMGVRPDLVDLAASAEDADDKETLNDVVKQAEAAAAGSKKANTGTALHAFTQKMDRGDTEINIPAAHRERVQEYKRALERYNIGIIPNMIEITLLFPELELAGTADRFVHWGGGDLPVVDDLKTGGTIDFSRVAIAMQLAAYANSPWVWNHETQKLDPMPEVDKKTGLVLHLPSTGDIVSTLYRVNIEEGLSLLKKAVDVKQIQKTKGKHLFTEVEPSGEPTESANREEELRARVKSLVSAGRTPELAAIWDRNVPTLAEGGLTEGQLNRVDEWVTTLERKSK